MYPSKYQPYLFNDVTLSDTCCNTSSFVQRIFQTDAVNFQFVVTPCPDATEVIENPTFNDGNSSTQAGWDASGGAVSYNIGGTGAWLQENGSQILQDALTVTADTWSYLRVDVKVITATDTTFSSIQIGGFSESISFPAATGTYLFYVNVGPNDEMFVRRNAQDDASDIVLIQNVSLLEIDLPTIEVQDLDGVQISTDVITEYNAPYLNVFFQPDTATINAGCFKIEVERTCSAQTYLSEVIQIVPENDCDLLIGACGDLNVWGINFAPYMRLQATIRSNESPEYDRFTTRKTNGRYRMDYGRISKMYLLSTPSIPEHVRDFIYALYIGQGIGVKKGVLDQKNYFAFDEPEISTVQQDDDGATLTMRLTDLEQNTEALFRTQCNNVLPPKALGSRAINIAIKAATDTGIEVP